MHTSNALWPCPFEKPCSSETHTVIPNSRHKHQTKVWGDDTLLSQCCSLPTPLWPAQHLHAGYLALKPASTLNDTLIFSAFFQLETALFLKVRPLFLYAHWIVCPSQRSDIPLWVQWLLMHGNFWEDSLRTRPLKEKGKSASLGAAVLNWAEALCTGRQVLYLRATASALRVSCGHEKMEAGNMLLPA